METKNLKRNAKIAVIPALLVMAAAALFAFCSLGNVGLVFTTFNTPNALISANVVITSVCYISVAPTTIAFGSVYSGGNTLTNFVLTDTDTGGDAPANILLSGNALWTTTSAGSYNSFGVGNTLWDSTNDLAYTGTHLTSSLFDSKIQVPAPSIATPSTTANVYFGLGIPGGTFASEVGTPYTTTITVEDSC